MKQNIPGDHVEFGDVAREQMKMQCQYGVRYLLPFKDHPYLGDGLRTTGDIANYHFVTIHKDDVATFIERYEKHKKARNTYDGACQAISKQGGFLYGQKNHVEYTGHAQDIDLSFRDADLLLKVCEGTGTAARGGMIEEDAKVKVDDFVKSLSKAMKEANVVYENWRHDVS